MHVPLDGFDLPGTIVLLQERSTASAPEVARVRLAERRRREHARGRMAARAALTSLAGAGLGAAPLRADSEGLVEWPARITGSISHSGPWAVSAVGHSFSGVRDDGECGSGIRGIGVDVETVLPSRAELWERVVMPEDAASAPAHVSRAFIATVCFSLRESVYKCVYPVLRQPMDWPDARFTIDWESGRVEVSIDSRFAGAGSGPGSGSGACSDGVSDAGALAAQFREVEGTVVSGCWWLGA